jgi:hypothetical protein
VTADSTHTNTREQANDEPRERTEPTADSAIIIAAFAAALRAYADAANTPGVAPDIRLNVQNPSRWDPFPIADVLLDTGALATLTARLAVLTRQAERARTQQA